MYTRVYILNIIFSTLFKCESEYKAGAAAVVVGGTVWRIYE